jgi:hypothetical protein
VLNIIDSIHADGEVTPIQVLCEALDSGTDGCLDVSNWQIKIDPLSERKELAIAHEIGHLLDWEVWGKNGRFGSDNKSVVLQKWLKTVTKTDSYKRMNHLRKVDHYIVQTPNGSKKTEVKHGHLISCLSPHELWACSYAQYVATKSENATVIRAQIDKFNQSTYSQMYARYWKQPDFLDVAHEISELFGNLGWLV